MKITDISVVAANYNNSAYLKKFFESLSSSSFYPREIIFVDDASTDDSLQVVRTLKVQNLKLICLDENIGFSNALNIGVENSSCKYIMRIDPDDFIDPERIKKQFEFMENNPDVDVLGSNCVYFNESLNKYVAKSEVKVFHSEIMKRYQNGEHGMIHGTIICRSYVLKTVKYKQENYPAEEYDIFCRMILSGYRFHNLESALLSYRIHGRSVSNKMPYTTIKKIFELNELYFNKRNSAFKVFRTFLFLRNYRNFLEHKSMIKRYFFLLICVVMKPESIMNRIKIQLYKTVPIKTQI